MWICGRVQTVSYVSFPLFVYLEQKSHKVSAHAPEIVPALVGVLDDSDRYVRSGALWRLGMYGSNAAPTVPKIVGCLNDADVRVRTEATNAIQLIDPEAARAAGVN